MRNYFHIATVCAILLASGCQTISDTPDPNEAPPPKNPGFTTEMDKFNKQFPSAKATAYETETLAFNNTHKLDEKGNCHGKSIYPVTIILLLDAEGRVTSSTTDVENTKARCFRQAYAGVKFPRPPVAPYRKPIILK